MTSLLRRLASNGLFRLSFNRHREGKFQNYGEDEKNISLRKVCSRFCYTEDTPHDRAKDRGAVPAGRPHAHATDTGNDAALTPDRFGSPTRRAAKDDARRS
jgi:hypothetical protein